MRSFLLLAAVLVAAGGPVYSAADCTANDAECRGAAVRAARERLAAIPLNESDTLVKPEARGAIEALKDRIVDYILSAVPQLATDATAETAQRRLNEQGGAVEDVRDFSLPGAAPDRHGASLSYQVTRQRGHPFLMVVIARFGIMCGEDSLFFIFERTDRGARPLIVRRSAPLIEISGAWENLQFALSPRDERGRWYVAMSHTPPWCQSVWRSLTYDLARPGAEPTRPDVFFSRTVEHNIDSDVPLALRAGTNRLQVEHDGGIRDVLINRRRHVETYAIAGRAVRRIQPVAFNVRDFVDEWLSAGWAEASGWSAAAPSLAVAHRTVRAALYTEHGPSTFRAIRRCSPDLHDVQLGPDPLDREADGLLSWHFLVRGRGPYRLERAERNREAACAGPDVGDEIEAGNRRQMGFPAF